MQSSQPATSLAQKHCAPCKDGAGKLTDDEAQRLLLQLQNWEITDGQLTRDFKFKNFYHTMAFVNAVAYLANREDHHPDLSVGYDYCQLRFSTHSVAGLTENDFICAARVNALMEG